MLNKGGNKLTYSKDYKFFKDELTSYLLRNYTKESINFSRATLSITFYLNNMKSRDLDNLLKGVIDMICQNVYQKDGLPLDDSIIWHINAKKLPINECPIDYFSNNCEIIEFKLTELDTH